MVHLETRSHHNSSLIVASEQLFKTCVFLQRASTIQPFQALNIVVYAVILKGALCRGPASCSRALKKKLSQDWQKVL
jgi:hypothetical protein